MFYKKIKFEDAHYNLFLDNVKQENNVFTVIIGNNGIGKSRFLAHLIKETYRNNFEDINLFYQDERISKIVAITSSPFDKFPPQRLFNRIENYKNKSSSSDEPSFYKYLGLKDDRGIQINKYGNFLKIIDSLFDTENFSNEKKLKLASIFDFLGYLPNLRLTYKKQFRTFYDLIVETDSVETFIELVKYKNSNIINRFLNKIERDHSIFHKLREILLDRNLNFRESNNYTFDLNLTNPSKFNKYSMYLKMIQFLRKFDLVTFENLYLWKKNNSEAISLEDTSSGERAIFFNILGIASQIENNSLICIDEPEISLHPEWQEKYMKLLINTFNDYKKCHFIIATHSPSIISDLSEENCYILNMDENITANAKKYINHSSDYQLANLFKVPGFRNEYLNRECINLLSKISKNSKNISYTDLNSANEIIKLLPKLDDNDPIKELILILQKSLMKLNQ